MLMGGVNQGWSSLMTRPSRDQQSTCAEVLIVQAQFLSSSSVLQEKSNPALSRYFTSGRWLGDRRVEGEELRKHAHPALFLFLRVLLNYFVREVCGLCLVRDGADCEGGS